MNTYKKYCPNVFVALSYASKRVKELNSKYETAVKLWD